MGKREIVCVLLFVAGFSTLRGQSSTAADTRAPLPADHDTSFYHSYRNLVTARAYLSRKYTSLKFRPPGGLPNFNYSPNTTLNLGIGATYHAFTLNIGIGFTRFNPNGIRGKTKYLDLQGHFYGRKWNIDLLGEFYRGYYLRPKGLAAPAGQAYYKRKDLALDMAGVAFYRNLNERRFSYGAGLLQNEWQKKSAGSLLAGGEIYYGAVHGDSSLAPSQLASGSGKQPVNKLHFFEAGPSVGYAYTLVVRQHFFVLASLTVNLALRFSAEQSALTGEKDERVDFTPNSMIRAALGYNSDNWSLGALWVRSRLNVKGPLSDNRYGIETGNYRLIFAKRFDINNRLRRRLQPVPDLLGE